jgi:integrase
MRFGVMAMASATKRGPGRWLGRYRGPDGKERTKTFPTKGEALAWGQAQESRMRSLDWTDPARAKVTVGDWSQRWLGTLRVKPKTRAEYTGLLNTAVLPRWGAVRLDRVNTADVRGWVATMSGAKGKPLSPSRVRQAHGILSAMLDLAVEDGRLPKNPARPSPGSRGFLPKLPKNRTHTYLSHGQLLKLADEAGEYRALILVLGYGGLRWGEATALRVCDVDVLRSRLSVRRAVSEVSGSLTYGTTKSHGTRTVPFPAFMRSELESGLEGKGPDDLLFTSPQGGPLRNQNFRKRVFDPAARAAGIHKIKPHDLRHTAASLAIAAGANPKAVQKMLGHASAAMTLDTYADLFESDLAAVAERLNDAVSDAAADYLRTGHGVRTLPVAASEGQ